jgi:hypothetical protein
MPGLAQPTSTRFADQVARSFVTQPDSLMAVPSRRSSVAPGWREKVGTNMNQETLRAALIQYWSDKVMALGLPRARHWELIKGDHGQRLYWLILLARNDLAHDLWERISSAAKAPTFDF